VSKSSPEVAREGGVDQRPGLVAAARRLLLAPADDRRFWLFLTVFGAYLAGRGWYYRDAVTAGLDYGLLLPAALLLLPSVTRRWAALGALVVEAGFIAEHVWILSNHGWLEALLLVLLVFVPGRDRRGRALCVRALMAIFVIVVFWTGVKKVMHGLYLNGDFFALVASQPGKFFERSALLVSEDAHAQLRAFQEALRSFAWKGVPGVLELEPPRPWPLAAVSWLLCYGALLGELVLPVLLCFRRTRAASAVGLIVFFLAVEALALEWHFALLVFGFLLLFLPLPPWGWGRRGEARARRGASAEQASPARSGASRAQLGAVVALIAVLTLWPVGQYVLTRTHALNPWKLCGFAMYTVPGRFKASKVYVRLRGEDAWRRYKLTLPGAPRNRIEAKLRALVHAPFASGEAVKLAAAVRSHLEALGRDAEAVQVRSRYAEYDRELDRFRLVEHVYDAP
jgi:hypothetical protein